MTENPETAPIEIGPIKLRSRILSLFDRWFAANWFSGLPEREISGRIRQINADAVVQAHQQNINKILERLAREEPGAAESLELLVRDSGRKLKNKAAVVSLALEHLSTGPTEIADSGADSVAEDWSNNLEGYAERASTKEAREMWAEVLAREIQKPGSFSKATLRFLSEMDREVANLFIKHTARRIGDSAIPKPTNLNPTDVYELGILEENGLIRDVNSTILVLNLSYKDGHWYFYANGYGLRIKSPRRPNIPVISFTRVGVDILNILDEHDPEVGPRFVAETLKNNAKDQLIQGLWLCEVTFTAEGMARFNPLETILEPPPPPEPWERSLS